MRKLAEGRVLVWDRALGVDSLRALDSFVPWQDGQTIVTDAARALALAERFRLALRLNDYVVPFTVGPEVTITDTTEPTKWHRDAPRGATHKLLVYWNDVAGTLFRVTDPEPHELLVPGVSGTIVLFDIRLEHRSAPTRGRRKRAVGLRVRFG